MDYNEELQKAVNDYWQENKDDLDPFRIGEYDEAFRAGAKWQDNYIRARLAEQVPFCMVKPEGSIPVMIADLPDDIVEKLLGLIIEKEIKSAE